MARSGMAHNTELAKARPPGPMLPTKYRLRRAPEDLLAAFLRRFSEHTRRAYNFDLEDFAKWLGMDGAGPAVNWFVSLDQGEMNQAVFDFMADLKARGKAAATINRRRASLRSVLSMARLLGMTTAHIEVKRERMEHYRDTAGPGAEKLRHLLTDLERKAQAGNRKATRDLAITRLLFNRGLRKGEVASLDVGHYDRPNNRLSILGKARGGREWVTLPTKALSALDAWLEIRGTTPGPMFPPLTGKFAGIHNGGRLTDRNLGKIFKPYGIRAHGLRHAAITAALEATDGDIPRVMAFSRHKNVQTVMIYDDRRQDLGGKVSELLDGLDTPTCADPPPITEADFAKLTDIQARRLRLVLDGRSLREMADVEGISQVRAQEIMTACERRIPHLRQRLELAGVRKPKGDAPE